jgi:hypothetical protein
MQVFVPSEADARTASQAAEPVSDTEAARLQATWDATVDASK